MQNAPTVLPIEQNLVLSIRFMGWALRNLVSQMYMYMEYVYSSETHFTRTEAANCTLNQGLEDLGAYMGCYCYWRGTLH